jgi:hypothetical protein
MSTDRAIGRFKKFIVYCVNSQNPRPVLAVFLNNVRDPKKERAKADGSIQHQTTGRLWYLEGPPTILFARG